MKEIYLLMLMTGFTGGFGHCIGMCGPIVASYSVAMGIRGISPHILYNAGRITTYALLGAVVGFAGSYIGEEVLLLKGYSYWLRVALMMAAGLLIVLMGLSMAGFFPLMKSLEKRASSLLLFRKMTNIFSKEISAGAFYPMGALLGFIPCGLVYSALMVAARAGMDARDHASALIEGGLLMIIFGLGTVPALLFFGKIINFIGTRARERFYRLSALFVILMGIVFIVRAVKIIQHVRM